MLFVLCTVSGPLMSRSWRPAALEKSSGRHIWRRPCVVLLDLIHVFKTSSCTRLQLSSLWPKWMECFPFLLGRIVHQPGFPSVTHWSCAVCISLTSRATTHQKSLGTFNATWNSCSKCLIHCTFVRLSTVISNAKMCYMLMESWLWLILSQL